MAMTNPLPSESNFSISWQHLLVNAERNASFIVNEVMNDAVLGKSVTAAVAPYLSQCKMTARLREEYASVDRACREARTKADDVMRSVWLAKTWQLKDLKVVDEDLWATLCRLTAHASAVNQKRNEAILLERELLLNAIDVIDTCSGISALRHLNEFRCKGDAFCSAYMASLLIADSTVDQSIKIKGMKVISDFLQHALGLKEAYRHSDVYSSSKTILGLGRAMGIENTHALANVLSRAVDKMQ